MIADVRDDDGLRRCAELIRASFATVAAEFGITEENAPTNPAFITIERIFDAAAKGAEFFVLTVGATASEEAAVTGGANDVGADVDGAFPSAPIEVGCVAVEPSKDDATAYYIERVAVLPAFRHRGYGALLVDHALSAIRKRGGREAQIGLIDENGRLKRWYINMGFVETGKKKFSHLPFTVCFMKKPIT